MIPTEEPEADGTLAWDQTAMVVVRAAAGGQEGIGWTYASPAAQEVVTGLLAGTVCGRHRVVGLDGEDPELPRSRR